MSVDPFKKCPVSSLCSATIKKDQLQNQLNTAEEKIKVLSQSQEIIKVNGLDSINEEFSKALGSKLMKEKDEEIFELQKDLGILNIKLAVGKKEIEKLSKENKLKSEMLDRDVELQETEKKYQILVIDIDKFENKKQILESEVSKLLEDKKHATDMYNEMAEAHNKVLKEIRESEKYLKVLRPKVKKQKKRDEKASKKAQKKEEKLKKKKLKKKKTWFFW